MGQQLSLGTPSEMSGLINSIRTQKDEGLRWQATHDFLEKVINWSKHKAPDTFDDSFIHSVYMQFHDRDFISPRQVEALINVAIKFEIT